MTTHPFRLSFHSRALTFFVGLVALTILGVATVMFFAAKRTSLGLAERQLQVTERIVGKALESQGQQLRAEATTVAADFGFREAIVSKDTMTIVSALENQRARLHADAFALLDNEGSVVASADGSVERVRAMLNSGAPARINERADVSMVLSNKGQLLQVVVVPVKAPDTIAFVFVGVLVRDALVQAVKETAGVDVSLLANENSRLDVVASSLPADARAALERSSTSISSRIAAQPVTLAGETFLTSATVGRGSVDGSYLVVSQMPMSAVTAPMTALRRDMLVFGGVVTTLCLLVAIIGARILAQPVRALSHAARSLSLSKRRGKSGPDDELAHVARAFHALARRAHYDGLTGLPNRTLLNERLGESLDRMQQDKQTLAVVFIDLNGFKKINDTLGHEMGDLVLRKAAQRLSRYVAAPNTVARLGGDEFVLVFENISQAEAMNTVEKLAKIVARPMVSANGPIKVGMSAGIAMYPSMAAEREQLLQLADAAMYESKTRKAGPVMATALEKPKEEKPNEKKPTDEITQETGKLVFGDTTSNAPWRGRDLETQSTRAISAINPHPAPTPPDETARLRALRRLKYLDKPARASFDRITRLAVKTLHVPIALVSLVDEERQWFLSRVGLDVAETQRDISFCAHAIFERKPLLVPDATQDERFAANPLVVNDPKIRAYAGMPLYTTEGHAVGTLCVLDRNRRDFSDADVTTLQDLAQILEDMIRIREFTLQYDRRRRLKSAAVKQARSAASATV